MNHHTIFNIFLKTYNIHILFSALILNILISIRTYRTSKILNTKIKQFPSGNLRDKPFRKHELKRYTTNGRNHYLTDLRKFDQDQ